MIRTDELYRKIYENAEKEYTEYITELKEKDADYCVEVLVWEHFHLTPFLNMPKSTI